MPSLPHNIEKSAFRRGEYVGYAAGYVFRVERLTKPFTAFGNWQARLARYNPVSPHLSARVFYASTLADMGAKLDAFAIETKANAIVAIDA